MGSSGPLRTASSRRLVSIGPRPPPETSFQEVGAVTFGAGNVLRFSTIGQGHLAPGADPARRHGAVSWRVDGGEGEFAGATGLITSNVVVGADLGIVDHQFGVLWLP